MQDGEPFLGYANLQGTAFTESLIATGLGRDFLLFISQLLLNLENFSLSLSLFLQKIFDGIWL